MKNLRSEAMQFADMLPFGKTNALTAETIFEIYKNKINAEKSFVQFARHIRELSAAARKEGIRVIGDNNGYYLAANNDEWFEYKRRRFAALRDELESFANCEHLTVRDLIKDVYCIKVEDKNYELNL